MIMLCEFEAISLLKGKWDLKTEDILLTVTSFWLQLRAAVALFLNTSFGVFLWFCLFVCFTSQQGEITSDLSWFHEKNQFTRSMDLSCCEYQTATIIL